jgi:membrane protease YdiL (CAAX protease family)
MNYTPSICSICGSPLQHTLNGANCPQCAMPDELISPAAPPIAETAVTVDAPPWGVWTGLGVWLASVVLMLVLQLVGLVGYALIVDRGIMTDLAKGNITPAVILVSLVGTFAAQAVTLALAWLIVTRAGTRPFLTTLGWDWHPQFRLAHAVGLTLLMLGFGWLASKALPHKETSIDKILEMGLAVRVTVAILATLGAPIVEEVVYRGMLYPAIERVQNTNVAVIVVTLLFWGVHVSQYYQSVAVLVSLFVLSLALTLVRAVTGSLLPCVVTHFLFNGVQALGIIFASEAAVPAPKPVRAALTALFNL